MSSSTIHSSETVEGVWIFHRHGDRSPGKPLVAEHMYEAESAFWRTKIPPTDRSYYHALCEKYPTYIHESNNSGNFLDVEKEPFGFLSWKGMNQMYETGKGIGERYFGKDQSSSEFVMDWDVKAYSTNYLRTVMSVQCFMDGLLHPFTTSNGQEQKQDQQQQQHYYENLATEEFHSSRESFFTNTNNNRNELIQVRDRKDDTLNAFDKRPEYMKNLVKNVVATSSFIDIDSKAGCLAARLANFLPGLANASSYGGPSGINWIHAADHFVCRTSHDLPFSKFSHSENDPHAEETLDAMSYGVISHLCWRFRTWYQSPPLLAAVAGPPLEEIGKGMMDALERDTQSSSAKKPFVVYSCHDVTVLSLLYGVGADFLAPKKDLIKIGINPGNDERWRFWPKYASTLVFELVRRDDAESNGIESSSSHFVRIFLNGEEIRTIESLRRKKDVLSVLEFTQIIKELNSQSAEEMKTELNGERDMSNWTG